MLDCAGRNLERAGLSERVELKRREFQAALEEREVDVVTMDIMKPWRELKQVHEALKDGGYMACTVLTYNQLETLAESMPEASFLPLETMEILSRPLRPRRGTTRPKYDMLAHTHLLQFGVKVTEPVERDGQPRLVVRHGDEEHVFRGGMPAWRLLEKLELLPDTVLVLRDGTVVTHEERLEPGDDVEILPVTSGS
jgi:sulfur carrier protein ThiS